MDELTVDLFPIDAGTDSGLAYTSRNSDTQPRERIRTLRGASPFSEAPIGQSGLHEARRQLVA